MHFSVVIDRLVGNTNWVYLSGDRRLRNKFLDTEGGKDDGDVKKGRGRVFFSRR